MTGSPAPGVAVLVVDNHDSFVHTLVGYLLELGAEVTVREADEIPADAVVDAITGFSGVILSPGPGRPEDAGASIAVVHAAAGTGIPLLGVCLGHQVLAVAFRARVVEAPELMHGMTSAIEHDGEGIFIGLPSPFVAGRYHSLAVAAGSLPRDLVVTARTADGTVMGISHRTLPLHGVQFHPESVLTEHGYRVLGTWLESLGLRGAIERAATLSPHRGRAEISPRST